MNIIIIEDEKPAARLLQRKIEKLGLQVNTMLHSVEEAIIWFQKNQHPDLIFLDIQLSDGLSFEIFEQIDIKSAVIFTTAYDKYALTGYDLGVIDYLLKPFSFERFVIAVQKCFYNLKSDRLIKSDSGELPYLLIKVDKDIKRFDINSIYYFKSFGNYTKLFLQNREILCSEPLSKIEIKVSDHNFIRVHRSYIISKSKITNILSNAVCLDNYSVPLGNRYKLNL